MKKNLLLLLYFTVFILNSCKKSDPKDTDTIAPCDNAYAESIFENIVGIADEAGYKIKPFTGILSDTLATVTYDTLNASDADTITINFGTANSHCIDSRTRRGKIIVKYTGNYTDSACTHTITFLNYFVDDGSVTGTLTYINNGHNAAGKTIFRITTTGSHILPQSGGTIIWNCDQTREWTSGEGTPTWEDDVYTITGDMSGAQNTGPTFVAHINIPLIRSFLPGCRRHFTKGSIQLESTDHSLRTLDFGSGSCDDAATVSIDGVLYPVNLR